MQAILPRIGECLCSWWHAGLHYVFHIHERILCLLNYVCESFIFPLYSCCNVPWACFGLFKTSPDSRLLNWISLYFKQRHSEISNIIWKSCNFFIWHQPCFMTNCQKISCPLCFTFVTLKDGWVVWCWLLVDLKAKRDNFRFVLALDTVSYMTVESGCEKWYFPSRK